MRKRTQRGFTAMELVTAMAISVVLTVLVVEALVGLAKDRTNREYVVEVQGSARSGLSFLEQDVRTASLGSGTGVIWINAGGTRTAVTSVQIYDNVAGAALITDPSRGNLAIGPKPGSDVLLVARALRLQPGTVRAAAVGEQVHVPWTPTIAVSDVTQFSVNDLVVFGDYTDAAWDQVTQIDATNRILTLASPVDLFPRRGVGAVTGKLASGSMVRRAQARLYYVDVNDELVRLTLTSPVAPADNGPSILGREVLATGFENLQIDCQMDGGGGALTGSGVPANGCPAPLPDATATAALGVSSSRINPGNVATLRTLVISAVVRSTRPVREMPSDPPLAVGSQAQALPASVPAVDVSSGWVRRAYQLQIAVRNTSLGVL